MVDTLKCDLQCHTMCMVALCADQPIPYGTHCDDFVPKTDQDLPACERAMDEFVELARQSPVSVLMSPWSKTDSSVLGWQCQPAFGVEQWARHLRGFQFGQLLARHPKAYIGLVNGLLQCIDNEVFRRDAVTTHLLIPKTSSFLADMERVATLDSDRPHFNPEDRSSKEKFWKDVLSQFQKRFDHFKTQAFSPHERDHSVTRWLRNLFTEMVFQLQNRRESFSLEQLEAIVADFDWTDPQFDIVTIYRATPSEDLLMRIGEVPKFPLYREEIRRIFSGSSKGIQQLLLKTLVVLADAHPDMRPNIKEIFTECTQNESFCYAENQAVAQKYLVGEYQHPDVTFHREVPSFVHAWDPLDFSIVARGGAQMAWLGHRVWSPSQEIDGRLFFNEGSGPAVMAGGGVAAGLQVDFFDQDYLTALVELQALAATPVFDDQAVWAYVGEETDTGREYHPHNMDTRRDIRVGVIAEYDRAMDRNWRFSMGAGLHRLWGTLLNSDSKVGGHFESWQLMPQLGVKRLLGRSNGDFRSLLGVALATPIGLSGCTRFPSHMEDGKELADFSFCEDTGLQLQVYFQGEWGVTE